MRASPISNSRLPWRALFSLLLVAVALSGLPGRVFAETSSWSSATSGSWNVDGNWTNTPAEGGFPNNGNEGVADYNAVISSTGSPYTVTLDTSVTVDNLTISSTGATLDQTSGIFTATGQLNISAGVYQLDGGTIQDSVITTSGSGVLIAGDGGDSLLTGVTVDGDLYVEGGGADYRGLHLYHGASD